MAFAQLISSTVERSRVRLTNGEASTVAIGTVVYIGTADTFLKAQADNEVTTPAFGIVTRATTAGSSGVVQTSGIIALTTTQWDSVAGTTGGLSAGVVYYLSAATAGRLTATPPSAVGDVKQQVLVALSTTKAKISILAPEVIGSGASLIRLENNDATAVILGTPVYADAPGGFDSGLADGSGKSTIIGLVADSSIASGSFGLVATSGVITAESTADWDAVAGTTGGLTFNTPYYLDPTTPGRLTATAPTTNGHEVVQVLVGISTTKARIAIQPAVLL